MKPALCALALATLSTPAKAVEFVDANANHCEFYVDGLAMAYTYNMGWSRSAIHAEYHLADPSLEQVGMWVRFRDGLTGEESSQIALGGIHAGSAPGASLEFTLSETIPPSSEGQPAQRLDREPLAISFFASKTLGVQKTLRLWISNQGRNFAFSDILNGPTYPVSLGRTTLTWVDQSRAIFDQKRACAR